MFHNPLTEAIDQFTGLVFDLPDDDLEKEWTWGSYDSEGIRFAFFRTYEELRELAVKLRALRISSTMPHTDAQLILSQYHTAYMDLQTLFLGIDSELAERSPAEGEWSLREILAHIVGADLGFYVVIKYALDRVRQGGDPLEKISNETWLAIAGLDEVELDAVMGGPMGGLQTLHGDLHERILVELADISQTEIEMPSRYWEKEPLSLRFRLHRFDSHIRQHTVQVEKTLRDLGYVPREAKRLLRLIYAALAEINGALIGAPGFGETEMAQLAEGIEVRTIEIEGILKG